MAKNVIIFDKIPHPKTQDEHEQVQIRLLEKEKEEHQMIEITKGIEVMDKYSNDNEFILSALQERCQDYRDVLTQLEESINNFSSTIKDEDIKELEVDIEKPKQAFEDYEFLNENLELQGSAIASIEKEGDPVDKKLQELETIKKAVEKMDDENESPTEYIMEFIKEIQKLKLTDEDEGEKEKEFEEY